MAINFSLQSAMSYNHCHQKKWISGSDSVLQSAGFSPFPPKVKGCFWKGFLTSIVVVRTENALEERLSQPANSQAFSAEKTFTTET